MHALMYDICSFSFKSRHLFLTVLEAGKSKIKVLASSIPNLQMAFFLLCAHMVETELEVWSPFPFLDRR